MSTEPYEPSTVRVTDVSLRPDGKVAIQMTMVVDPRRLIDVTSELLQSGIASWSDLRARMEAHEEGKEASSKAPAKGNTA